MKVTADVTLIDLQNEHGENVPSVCVTCTRCNHSVNAWGRRSGSLRFALLQLNRQCPSGENNMYYDGKQTEEEPQG